jgi:hypothetical protein
MKLLRKKDKVLSPKKQAKMNFKNAKRAIKQKKREARIAKRTPGVASNAAPVVRTHITKLPLIGSKMLQSLAAFSAAGAFYQYEVIHNLELTAVFGGATVAISIIAAAPYAKSILRANSSLYNADMALSRIDSAIGSQQALISQVISEIEAMSKNQGFTPEIQKLHDKIDQLQKSLDKQEQATKPAGSQPSSPGVAVVHSSGNNVKVE